MPKQRKVDDREIYQLGPLQCAFCGLIYARKDSLHRHIREAHRDDSGEELKCKLCPKTFARGRKHNLERHYRRFHGTVKSPCRSSRMKQTPMPKRAKKSVTANEEVSHMFETPEASFCPGSDHSWASSPGVSLEEGGPEPLWSDVCYTGPPLSPLPGTKPGLFPDPPKKKKKLNSGATKSAPVATVTSGDVGPVIPAATVTSGDVGHVLLAATVTSGDVGPVLPAATVTSGHVEPVHTKLPVATVASGDDGPLIAALPDEDYTEAGPSENAALPSMIQSSASPTRTLDTPASPERKSPPPPPSSRITCKLITPDRFPAPRLSASSTAPTKGRVYETYNRVVGPDTGITPIIPLETDPRLGFLGAPSLHSRDPAAVMLRGLRGEALEQGLRRVRQNQVYPGCVIREEEAILANGDRYRLSANWFMSQTATVRTDRMKTVATDMTEAERDRLTNYDDQKLQLLTRTHQEETMEQTRRHDLETAKLRQQIDALTQELETLKQTTAPRPTTSTKTQCSLIKLDFS